MSDQSQPSRTADTYDESVDIGRAASPGPCTPFSASSSSGPSRLRTSRSGDDAQSALPTTPDSPRGLVEDLSISSPARLGIYPDQTHTTTGNVSSGGLEYAFSSQLETDPSNISSPPSLPATIPLDYYRGIRSRPRCLATSNLAPTTVYLDEHPLDARLLPPLARHPASEVWNNSVGPAVVRIVSDAGLPWARIDLVRISRPLHDLQKAVAAADAAASAVVWIGVESGCEKERAEEVVRACSEMVQQNQLQVLVEVYVGEYFLLGGRPFVPDDGGWNRELELPLMAGLGLNVAPSSKEGHCLCDNRDGSMPFGGNAGEEVLLFSRDFWAEFLEGLRWKCGEAEDKRKRGERKLGRCKNDADFAAIENAVALARADEVRISALCGSIAEDRSRTSDRVIGRISCYPRRETHQLSDGEYARQAETGALDFAEDWGLVLMEDDVIRNVELNVLLLDESRPAVDVFPPEHPALNSLRLPVTGFVPLAELEKVVDLAVIKRGARTGETRGTMTGISSFRRADGGFVKELAIIGWPADPRVMGSPPPFSATGDSGSVALDVQGKAVGKITSGMGHASYSDITYATPLAFILSRIQAYTGLQPTLA